MFDDVFKKIGDEWMLIAAGNGSGCNAMTASWGGAGVLWGKRVCFVFVRPQRYTKEFLDDCGSFSLSFFDGGKKKELAYMGKVSGRDADKIKECGFDVDFKEGAPIFKQASQTLICKKLYCQRMEEDCFIDGNEVIGQYFKDKDFHFMYVGEIIDQL